MALPTTQLERAIVALEAQRADPHHFDAEQIAARLAAARLEQTTRRATEESN